MRIRRGCSLRFAALVIAAAQLSCASSRQREGAAAPNESFAAAQQTAAAPEGGAANAPASPSASPSASPPADATEPNESNAPMADARAVEEERALAGEQAVEPPPPPSSAPMSAPAPSAPVVSSSADAAPTPAASPKVMAEADDSDGAAAKTMGGAVASRPPPAPARTASGAAVDRATRQEPPQAEAEEKADKKEKAKGGKDATKVTTWKPAGTQPNNSRLTIGDNEELPLKGVQAHVQIDGFRARVVLDCFYLNDRGSQFEGTFKLRLPSGASPYFFAFGETVLTSAHNEPVYLEAKQIQGTSPQELMRQRQASWSAPKEARMVPKEKAAHAYIDTVRRQVDPALMEWAGAGVFSARVFPLLPGKLHRIVIGYDVDLTAADDDLEYRFDVPETEADRIVDITTAVLPGTEVVVEPAKEPQWSDAQQTGYRFKNPQEKAITVRLAKPGALLLAGEDAETGPYVAAAFRPALQGAAQAGAGAGVFLVDTSFSSSPERFNVWLSLLTRILDSNRDEMKQFAVLFFDIESHWWKEELVANTPANVKALIDYANSLALEGATDLGAALREAATPSWKSSAPLPTRDFFLLSDGAATWGETDLRAALLAVRKSGAGAVFAYNTGLAGTDQQLLAQLSRETGGALFSVTGEAEIEKAARAHRFRPWRLERIELAGASDLMLAGRPESIFPEQRLLLVGRGTVAANAAVQLTLRREGEPIVVTTKVERVLKSPLAVRAYGQVATNQLEELKDATEPVSTAYACHFRVTGDTASLLMLESEADYQRYNINTEGYAAKVKETPAAALIARILAAEGESLADPKRGMLAWLKKMTTMPGATVVLPPQIQAAIEGMPSESFAVPVPRLTAREHRAAALAASLREQLRKRDLDYDVVMADAEDRRKKRSVADALLGLSSLVENNPGDGVLARDVGFTAMAWGQRAQAYHLFRRVADARPFEPQTYLAMAEVLTDMGLTDLALAYYEVGLAGDWQSRFGEYKRILQLEYVRFLKRVQKGELKTSVPELARTRLAALEEQTQMQGIDLVVIITWNTDASDVDLHVVEPTGEECYYSHRETRIGGYLTSDVTQGYGPEMYVLPRAKAGAYAIRAKYFASERNRASARTKVYATVIENWGTKREKRTSKVVTLKLGKEMHDIALVSLGQ